MSLRISSGPHSCAVRPLVYPFALNPLIVPSVSVTSVPSCSIFVPISELRTPHSAFSSLSLRPVTFRRSAVRLQMPRRPQHPARHQIQIPFVTHRLVVVADRRAEHPRVLRAVIIHPSHHKIIRLRHPVATRNHLLA